VPRRLTLATLAVATLLAAAPTADAGFRTLAEPMQLPGDAAAAGVRADRGTWIVGARPGAAAEAAARGFAARRLGPASSGDYVVARRHARGFAGALRSRGVLAYAQPNGLALTSQAVPDDPLSGPPNAWRAAVADPGLAPPPVTPTSPLIALLDTRLDEAHPEFAGSAVSTLGDRPLVDLHGTATAAVAAAPANGVGIVGVWPGARALNVPLPPRRLTCAASASGVQRAIAAGAAVINMSYGSRNLCRAEYNALQRAVQLGIVPVAAAGNEFGDGNPPEFPASLPHVLTVAAVNARLDSSAFSNANAAVDLSAPGEGIMTAVPPAFDADGTPDGYQPLDGTSFSAPMVSGAVAWVRAARPDLSPDQVAQVVRLSSRDLARKGYDQDTGFGLLNLAAALAKAPPPRDPLEPNDEITFVNGRSFGTPSPAVFAGAVARLTALVDAYEDPADVYRVRLGARSRVRVSARPQFGDPVLAGFAPGTRSLRSRRLATSRRTGRRTERITLRNRSGRARTYFVAVGVQRGGRSLDAGYRLTLRR
jgi:Subtilase family